MTDPSDNWRLSRLGAGLTDSAIRALAKRMAGRSGIISFAGGMPSPATFPQAEFSRAFERVMQLDGAGALQYGPTNGYAPLREWIAQSLSVADQAISADQVLVVSGSQQGLDLIGKVLLDPGDVVGVETPTYLGALQALGQYFPEFVTLPSDAGGLIPEQAEAELVRALAPGRSAKFLYAIPTFQNPTGRTLSQERRVALVQACGRLRLPLVEDDPYGGLDHAGRRHTTCLSMDSSNVVYLGSFSKVLSPGIRLGYIVAPPDLVRRLELAKQASDLHSSSLLQRLVFEIVKDGFLTGHLAHCQATYRDSASAMSVALQRHLPDLARWDKPQGGMFQWLEFADGIDAGALLEQALAAGVAYVPGGPFYAHAPRHNTARLCFSTSTRQDIDKGIAILADVLRSARHAA
ncbi:MAG: PLP-dependent aminotransferase family protein [Burkholderiaceae bacterium]